MSARCGSAVGSALAIAMAVSGCATAPPAPDARHVIEVTAHDTGPIFPPRSAGAEDGPLRANVASIEAVCTATNDRGSWTINVPGRFEVIPSNELLKVTCRADRFKEVVVLVKCIPPQARTSAGLAYGLTMLGPFGAIVALPVLGVSAASHDVGDCTYARDNSLHFWLDRAP